MIWGTVEPIDNELLKGPVALTRTHKHTHRERHAALCEPRSTTRGEKLHWTSWEKISKVRGLKFFLLSSSLYIYKYFTLLFHTALVLKRGSVEIWETANISSCCVSHDKPDKGKETGCFLQNRNINKALSGQPITSLRIVAKNWNLKF